MTTMRDPLPQPGPARGYALSNSWELAERRLELLEACHDAASIRRAEALGVGRGWECLDAGAGHGSFARWLAGRVGPEGCVVAADIDTRLLERLGAPGVEVRRMDVTADELPRGAFDFVHTRLLLLHLPSRDEVLARLAEALRPGGVLLVEEDDIHPILATATGAYREAWDAFLLMMGRAGVDPEWARDLPGRLTDLGLDDVEADVDTQLFPGGSAPARFWSLTWVQVQDRVAAMGVPPAVLDRGRAALLDPDRWFHGPAKVMASGRRPAP
jgi:SAM-dependent methyltransferase